MNRGRGGLLTLAAAAALVGCAADRVTGVLPPAAAASLASTAVRCSFNIEAIQDAREAGDLGALGFTRVSGEHFAGWFRAGVTSIPGHSEQPAPFKMRLEVAKAYIHAVYTMKGANIVVKARITGPQGSALHKIYRGVDASINWSSSESEVQGAFDAALSDLRRQLAEDLASLCEG